MSQAKINNTLSADNTAKLKEIEIKQKDHPVCPDIDYLERNVEAFCRMSSQFYNPEVQEALTCLVQSFIVKVEDKNFKRINEFTSSIQKFFSCKRGDEILQSLTLRTINKDSEVSSSVQVDELINEAYVGIKYLNDLRALTSSFKYIYTILTRNGIPYIIEENLDNTQSLENILSTLPPNEIGVRSVKSIILQLFAAVHYAAKIDVSNFPMNIVVRSVTNSFIPIHMDKSIIYVNTYGLIPVFERYYTAGSHFDNGIEHPKSLYREQSNILQYVMFTLNKVNPDLAQLIKCNGRVTSDFFTEIIQSRSIAQSGGFTVLSCDASARLSSCLGLKEIIHYFKVPFSRLDAYVNSGINRIDDLINTLNSLPANDVGIDQRFIITPVVAKYGQLLQDVAQKADEKSQVKLFDGYLDLVNQASQLQADQYKDQKYIKDVLDAAIQRGRDLQHRQQGMTLPDFTSRQTLLTAVQNFRILMANIYYFETTNALIDSYRRNIGPYKDDLTDALNEAEFIKERFEIDFAKKPQVIEEFIDTINNDNDVILVELYDTFVEEIKDDLKTLLHTYEVHKSPIELANLNQTIFKQKILALDPVPIIGF